MTNSDKRVHEVLGRVLVFRAKYPKWFAGGTVAAELMDEVKSSFDKLSEQGTTQLSGNGAIKRSTVDRAQSRRMLWTQLEAIDRIARALKLPQFWMPRDRGDRRAIDVGKAFVQHAQPLRDLFVANHLPEDFIDRLRIAVENLEAAITSQTVDRGTRRAATAAIGETRQQALAVLQRLDAIVQNLVGDDLPALAVWQSARRISWPAGSKPEPVSTAVVPTAEQQPAPASA